jgi:hypothetical protein
MTPTIRSVQSELSDRSNVTAWEIVKAILQRHFQFGRQTARQIAESSGPETGKSMLFDKWLVAVAELFDPLMVPKLHGRLVILGLSRLELPLGEFLRNSGFLEALEDELQEDFNSLLRPEIAGKEEAYRREFIKILQNRGKLDRKFGEPRQTGFVIVAKGGPGLETLAELCQRQNNNRCFTARYVVPSGSSLKDMLMGIVRDLAGLAEGNTNTLGDLVPDPVSDAKSWATIMTLKFRSVVQGMVSLQEDRSAGDMLDGLLAPLKEISLLPPRLRLIILFEFRAPRPGIDRNQLGFSDEVIGAFENLPERMGAVFSGLPEEVCDKLPDPPFRTLSIPDDPQKTRAQALKNDTPTGLDRLDVTSEVHALAEAIALKEMSPPMVVGVIGGWGAGKSFVLHLLEERIREIRCEQITPEPPENSPGDGFPFVGHPYLIYFDAWTYAKSNIWASLMQTVFTELDRQINLEQILQNDLKISLLDNTEIWRLLSRLTLEDQERLINTDLGKRAIQIVTDYDAGKREETASKLWTVLADLRKEETARLEQAETQLALKQHSRNEAYQALEEVVDEELNRRARRGAWRSIGDQVLRSAWEIWEKHASKNGSNEVPTYDQLHGRVDWFRKFIKGIGPLPVIFLLIAITTLMAPNLFQVSNWFVTKLTPVMSLLLGCFTWMEKIQTWVTESRQKFDSQVEEYVTRFGRSRTEIIEQAVAAIPEAAETQAVRQQQEDEDRDFSEVIKEKARALKKLESDVQKSRTDVETRRRQVGITARHGDLLALISDRIEGRYYEDKLGLLHQIKSDLEELSASLLSEKASAKLFPRGDPRIILLIDDLDRCPPERVVEVLEAVQLLVKTPLFVVVMAIDVRYITRALEMVYKGVLVRNGDPSGLHYIEKIIQIPYRVRPVSAAAVGGFLRAQMMLKEEDIPTPTAVPKSHRQEKEEGENGDSAASADEDQEARLSPARAVRTELRVLPTEILRFSRREHEAISACCSALEINPRAMKRLVNVYKLLKIIWHRKGFRDGPEEDVQKAMLALLVLGATYPEVMRQILHDMERRYTLGRGRTDDAIGATMSDVCLARSKSAIFQGDWTAVADALNSPEFFPEKLTFRDLQDYNLRLVSSFSFVGESDPAREAALRRGGTDARNADPQSTAGTQTEKKT